MGIIFLLFLFSSMTSAYASEETLTASHLPPNNSSFSQGSTNVVGDVLYLYAPPGDGITVSDIVVRQSGSAADSDISLLKLIRDINGNGAYDLGLDEILASTTTAGGIASFPGLNLLVSPDTTETVLIAFDISASASTSASIQSNIIYAGGDILTIAPDTVADFGTLDGATMSITASADTLTVSHIPPADFA
ncbi:MAG TPA: hypothetical protein DE036_00635, partial [Actinobacteria bacterium]|nr:hypothetical protein [Actinomycetota bacterium]